MNTNTNVIVYFNKDYITPCGSDYTIFTELKTINGINKRYAEHHKRMIKRNMVGFIVISRLVWWIKEYSILRDSIKKGQYKIYKLDGDL